MSGKNYVCVNCGESVQQLYKEYSSTVLKLTECKKCLQVADKYIECDLVIIIIDLILLNRKAYSHVIFNTDFPAHWKLWIIVALMEAFSDWSVEHPEETDSLPSGDQFATNCIQYYKNTFQVILRSTCFFSVVYTMTLARNSWLKINAPPKDVLFKIWKCVTLSSFGIFFELPSLIWDKGSSHEYHFAFVSLYTTLSQLIAYTVVYRCSKLWSILVILTAYFCKIFIFESVKVSLLQDSGDAIISVPQ